MMGYFLLPATVLVLDSTVHYDNVLTKQMHCNRHIISDTITRTDYQFISQLTAQNH